VTEGHEKLTPQQLSLEKWMLALRLDSGFPNHWLTTPLQVNRVKLFETQGLIEIHPDDAERKRLTAKGFALSDPIIRALA
jgi:coproporphyrinogen III oxidase-like Fe-S oxidoreductase